MRAQGGVKLVNKHMRNYFNDLRKPITGNDFQSMPYKRDVEGKFIRDASVKPALEEGIFEWQETAKRSAKTKEYWKNFIKLDKLLQAAMTTSDADRRRTARKWKTTDRRVQHFQSGNVVPTLRLMMKPIPVLRRDSVFWEHLIYRSNRSCRQV